jgi:parallel beta-helix repeat protein
LGAVIDSPGQYQLAGDLTCLVGVPPPLFCDKAAITITASNVHLDGQGFTLTGVLGDGIGIQITSSNVHIRNITVEQFDVGIEIKDGGSNHLNGVNLTLNSGNFCGGGTGLRISNSDNNQLINSTITINENWGVRILSSNRNQINNNEILNNRSRPGFNTGNVDLLSSNENRIINNDLSQGGLLGVRAQDSIGNVILNNVVNDTGVSSGFGTAILLASSTDNVIQGNLIDRQPSTTSPFRGIFLFDSTQNVVRANTVQNQNGGGIILFQGAVNNLIQANQAVNNTPWDLEDDNANCDANTWRANRFGTANQSCIVKDACRLLRST